MAYLPNTETERAEMLAEIGARSVDELFREVPRHLLGRRLELPEPLSEPELAAELERLARRNRELARWDCFLGAGIYSRFIPAVVLATIARPEFYTAYTPYQAEISQGMLQALFEYQSMMCDLLGMQVCNSSMYDWASAAGEAVRMASRVKGRKTVLFANSIGDGRLEVVRTYAEPMGVRLVPVAFETRSGALDLGALKARLAEGAGEVAALYIESPNVFGVIEEGIDEAVRMVHAAGGLVIVGVNPVTLSLLRDPGSYGADVVVGEGQPLGTPMNFGGPHMGIFAVKDIGLARSMPGRLIGITTTKDGAGKAFCMVLQTREQHIRREAATSNICTNQALLALAAAAYMSLLGKNGFKKLGEVNVANAHYAVEQVASLKSVKAPLFDGAFFGEFTIGYNRRDAAWVFAELAKRGVMAGYPLSRHANQIGQAGAYCVTEVHAGEDIARLVGALGGVV